MIGQYWQQAARKRIEEEQRKSRQRSSQAWGSQSIPYGFAKSNPLEAGGYQRLVSDILSKPKDEIGLRNRRWNTRKQAQAQAKGTELDASLSQRLQANPSHGTNMMNVMNRDINAMESGEEKKEKEGMRDRFKKAYDKLFEEKPGIESTMTGMVSLPSVSLSDEL